VTIVKPSLASPPPKHDIGPARTEPAGTPSLRSMVRRGTLWSMSGYGGSQVLRLAGNLLLTRLLMPEAFGLMALVNALQQGLQLFSDIGIGPSIIQGRRGDDPTFLNTAWTVQAVRGLLLACMAAAIAVPVARFYGEPLLAWVLVVSGSTALISGFNSTRIFSMYRHLELARVSAIEVGSQAVGLASILAWAAVDPSIWALVAGGVVGSITRLVLSHTLLPGISNRFRFDKSALALMLRFGRWILFSTALTFFVGQSDRLIFGKMVPLAMLGVYSVGAMIASMPSIALGRVASSVFFPVYSRVQNAGEDLRPVFTRVRRPVLLLAGWMIAGLAGGGIAAVRLLYDERYDQAGWIVTLLAFSSWFTVLESTNGAALLARGEAHWTAASSAAKLVGMLALIPLGYAFYGFPGAVAGLAASEVFKYAVSAFAVARAGLSGWPQELRLTGWVLLTAGLGWALSSIAAGSGWGRFPAAGLVFVVVTLAWAPLLAPLLAPAGSGRRAQLS
jgi:O-antigen/teichoic acid export membrane protein